MADPVSIIRSDGSTDAPRENRSFVQVSLNGLADALYAPPDYIVESILPRGYLTLLGGHGGMGKSMLALEIAAHVAAGREWAGLGVAKVPAAFVSMEDSGVLVRRRLRNVAIAYGLDIQSIESGVTVWDGTGSPPLMVEAERGHVVSTNAWSEVTQIVAGAGLIIIDNASDAFDGSENDRRQVRRFTSMLAELAKEQDAAVLLLAHIDKNAARVGAQGNSYSGSTAWHNGPRSRLALVEEDGEPVLRHEKHNLGLKHDPIRLQFNERGVLMPVTRATVAAGHADQDNIVYRALEAAIRAGTQVSTATASAYSAAKCLEPYLPPELCTAAGRSQVHRSLARLQDSCRIGRTTYRTSDRKDRERWELAHGGAV